MILDRRIVRDTSVVQLDGRDHEPLLECRGCVRGHRAGHHPTDVVVVTEGLNERNDLTLAEHRDRHREIGEVTDAALGEIDVVVEEDVALLHVLHRIVAYDRVNEGRVGPSRELPQLAIVDARPVVVLVSNHG